MALDQRAYCVGGCGSSLSCQRCTRAGDCPGHLSLQEITEGLQKIDSVDFSRHQPVMVNEVLELLAVRPGRTYLDMTTGTGGHAEAILEASSPDGKLIGVELDGEQLEEARQRLEPFGIRVQLMQGDYSQVDEMLQELGVSQVDGALLDLGVSTWQLAHAERGFSLRLDGELDMRYDQTSGTSAAVLLKKASEAKLEAIFREFGEERFSRRIARAIVRRRKAQPIRSTADLRELVERVAPRGRRRLHPATRVFQALRIFVNRELDNLKLALEKLPALLKPQGRLGIISFHSLEDRIVKWTFREQAQAGIYEILTKKPVRPSAEERSRNPRSRSAKLRAVEKIAPLEPVPE